MCLGDYPGPGLEPRGPRSWPVRHPAAAGASDLVAVIDAAGVVTGLSASFREALRVDPSDRPLLWELVHPNDVARVRAAVSAAAGDDEIVPVGFHVLDAQGRWLALDVTLRRQAGAVPPSVVVTATSPTRNARESARRHDRPRDPAATAKHIEGGDLGGEDGRRAERRKQHRGHQAGYDA